MSVPNVACDNQPDLSNNSGKILPITASLKEECFEHFSSEEEVLYQEGIDVKGDKTGKIKSGHNRDKIIIKVERDLIEADYTCASCNCYLQPSSLNGHHSSSFCESCWQQYRHVTDRIKKDDAVRELKQEAEITKKSFDVNLNEDFVDVKSLIKSGDSKCNQENPETRTRTSQKPYNCNECGNGFFRKSSLVVHLRMHADNYACKECGKPFTCSRDLKRHSTVHTGEKPYSCNKCGKTYSHKSNLNAHVKAHNGIDPQICIKCGKRFTRKDNLVRHLMTHAENKPHVCKECKRCFARKWVLNKHLARHFKCSNVFRCKNCNNTFSEAGQLNAHLMRHYKNPVICEYCGKPFARKGLLRCHLEIHTDQKLFNCEECGKRFNQKNGLTAHLKIHTGQKPFECYTCGKRFITKGSLRAHVLIHTAKIF